MSEKAPESPFVGLRERESKKVPAIPFVGLRPYEREDALLFFGRDELTDKLLQLLQRTRFIVVVGSSGCGKSSLIRAGLIPKLEAGYLAQECDRWKIMRLKPGDRPLRSLAHSVMELAKPGADEAQVTEVVGAIERMGLEAIRQRLQPVLEDGPSNLLVLVDQFEEIFTYGYTQVGEDPEHQEQVFDFVSVILGLAEFEDLPIYVVLTMRSDYTGECDAYPGLAEAINRSQYLVPRLDRRQRRTVIEGPIRLFGAQITEDLVGTLLMEMRDDNDQLPVLQYALMRTWSCWKAKGGKGQVDVDSYSQAGGIAGAIEKDAEEAYKATKAEGLGDLTKRMFQALTRLDANNRAVRRPLRLDELQGITKGKDGEIEQVIKRFCEEGRSFLMESKDSNPLIDISHESLIRQWIQLNKWVDEEAAAAESYRTLERAAQHWKGTKNKENLLKGYDLDRALDWDKKGRFTPEWAVRYGEEFELAIECLRASKKQRRRNLLRRYVVVTIVVVLFMFIPLLVETQLLYNDAIGWRKGKEAIELASSAVEMSKKDPQLAARLVLMAAVKSYTAEPKPSTVRKMRDVVKQTTRKLAAWLGLETTVSPSTEKPESPKGREISDVVRRAIQSILIGKPQESLLAGHTDTILAVAVDSQGTSMATASADRSVKIWDTTLGLPIITLGGLGKPGHNTSVRDVAFRPIMPSEPPRKLPRSAFVVATADDESVAIWDTRGGDTKSQQLRGAKTVAFSPDGDRLVVGGCPVTIYQVMIYQAEDWQPIWSDPGDPSLKPCPTDTSLSPKEVKYAAFGRTETEIVIADQQGGVRLVNTDRPDDLEYLRDSSHGPRYPIRAITNAHGHRLATTDGLVVKIWNLEQRHLETTLTSKAGQILGLDLSADGERVAAAIDDGTITVWHLEHERKSTTSAVYHMGHAQDVAFGPRGDWMVSAGTDSMLHKFYVHAEKVELERRYGLHNINVVSVVRSADGQRLATRSVDGTIMIWKANNMRLEHQLSPYHVGAIYHVEVSHDGQYLATASADSTVKLWLRSNNRSWKPFKSLVGHIDRVYDVSFNRNSTKLATASKDGTVKLWNIAKCLEEIKCEPITKDDNLGRVNSVEFSPDGKYLATASSDGKIRLRDADSGVILKTFEGHENAVFDVEFSPDSRHLVSASFDQSVRIWDIATGKSLHKPRYNTDTFLEAVTYSSGGDRIATGDFKGQVKIWKVTSGAVNFEEMFFTGSRVYDLKYSPDDNILAIGLENGSIMLRYTKRKLTRELKPSGLGKVYGLAFRKTQNEDNFWSLFSTSSNRTVSIWNLPQEPEPLDQISDTVIFSHEFHATAAAFSPNGEQLLVGYADGYIRLWDLSGPNATLVDEVEAPKDRPPDPVMSIVYDTKGQWVATSGKQVKFWFLKANGALELPAYTVPEEVQTVAFSPDRSKFLTQGANSVILWAWDSKEKERKLQDLKIEEGSFLTASFNPASGQLVTSWRRDGAKTEVMLHSFPSISVPDVLRNFMKEYKKHVIGLSFSSDGKHVATLDHDGRTVIWAWKPGHPPDIDMLFELSSDTKIMRDAPLIETNKNGLDIFTADGRLLRYEKIHDELRQGEILELLDQRSRKLKRSELKEDDECEKYMPLMLPITKKDEKVVNDGLYHQFKYECRKGND
jgi:WD40 repeat protein